MQPSKIPPSPEMIAIAEQLLTERFEGAVRLGEGDDLTASGRTGIYRFHVLAGPAHAPASVIVKQVRKFPPWTFFNDWASLQFLNQVISADLFFAPRFYAGNPVEGICIIEDLGSGQRLDQLLLGNDPVATEAALIEYAIAHGRLHALTIGRQTSYDAIRGPLGSLVDEDEDVTLGWLTSTFHRSIEMVGIPPAPGVDRELFALATSMRNPGPFLAFIQGDSCPDNCLYVGSALYLVDFEGGRFAHALLEGCYGRMHFPTCWCVYRLPEHILVRMETVYRAELVKGCPAATNDALFYRALVEACSFWVLDWLRWMPLGRLLESDRMIIAASDRQRLLTRLEMLAQTSEQFGYLEAIGATMRALATQLRSLWPETEEMELYPAFR
ncbi:hypothetical protein KSF_088440 [Reticulibacter mediterranei]|uniref:Aminoglycoside phosphotransferase domain-containing protein n=1 Tax=Reticulibacter mediterranei TaxID=2778369 RepID=A0A8J3J0X0_9CHLR|nr:hypothetical protein [Reticulibacter mediterranei]GHO98796.1 hypothetical protein KSF_088440 [Reticulibacter mediterranei]